MVVRMCLSLLSPLILLASSSEATEESLLFGTPVRFLEDFITGLNLNNIMFLKNNKSDIESERILRSLLLRLNRLGRKVCVLNLHRAASSLASSQEDMSFVVLLDSDSDNVDFLAGDEETMFENNHVWLIQIAGEDDQRLALHVLNAMPSSMGEMKMPLIPEHIENRSLYSPIQPGIEQVL